MMIILIDVCFIFICRSSMCASCLSGCMVRIVELIFVDMLSVYIPAVFFLWSIVLCVCLFVYVCVYVYV